jgi:hypothetical protein
MPLSNGVLFERQNKTIIIITIFMYMILLHAADCGVAAVAHAQYDHLWIHVRDSSGPHDGEESLAGQNS